MARGSGTLQFYYWHASEYLQISSINDIEYLAGFDDAQPGIVYGRMRPASAPYLFSIECDSMTADVNDPAASVRTPRLLLTGLRPARSRVGFRIELPARTRVFLAVYDVVGRRVRTLVDGELASGSSDLSWDGRETSGATVSAGVYFACMTTPEGRHSVRVPLLR